MSATASSSVDEKMSYMTINVHRMDEMDWERQEKNNNTKNKDTDKIMKILDSFEKDFESYSGASKFDRTLVLCRDDRDTRDAVSFVQPWCCAMFTTDMLGLIDGEGEEEIDYLLAELNSGTYKFAFCPERMFEPIRFSTMKHYIFLDFPRQSFRMTNILKFIEYYAKEDNTPVRVDFLTTKYDSVQSMRVLSEEMRKRDQPLPEWFEQFLEENKPPEAIIIRPVKRNRKQRSHKPSTSKPPTTKPSSKRQKPDEEFDINILKPNENGKYVIPACFVVMDSSDESDGDY